MPGQRLEPIEWAGGFSQGGSGREREPESRGREFFLLDPLQVFD
jgi:hypothetical protein